MFSQLDLTSCKYVQYAGTSVCQNMSASVASPPNMTHPTFALAGFRSSRLINAELAAYSRDCHCSAAIESRRAHLHATLQRVLVIDMRFGWNGVGNSMPRWLAALRFGLASGRATFLWMSDRSFERATPRGRRSAGDTRSKPASAGRQRAGVGRQLSEENGRQWPLRTNGFDLGEYFTAVGADWRWASGERVVETIYSLCDPIYITQPFSNRNSHRNSHRDSNVFARPVFALCVCACFFFCFSLFVCE